MHHPAPIVYSRVSRASDWGRPHDALVIMSEKTHLRKFLTPQRDAPAAPPNGASALLHALTLDAHLTIVAPSWQAMELAGGLDSKAPHRDSVFGEWEVPRIAHT